MNDTVAFYSTRATELAATYEAVSAEAVHAGVQDFIPRGEGLMALDVGAGSGRDAAWLGSLGYEVVAVEPAAAMRDEGRRRHPGGDIRWLDDRLPDLNQVHQTGLPFDLILLSAVWMHVPPAVRPRAFRKLVTLLKPGGVLLLSLRDGPSDLDRPMWPAPAGEIEALARSHGLAVLKSVSQPDALGRPDVQWVSMCLRLPDDGAGALPLLRGIILNDDKSSTYKLALVRAIARVADTAPALAVSKSDTDAVDIPLGLVALNWVRMYLPLVAAGLPQLPGNSGPEGLGFAKQGFRDLSALGVAAQDLRLGAQFSGDRAIAVGRALADARRTIATMPANYIRFPNSDVRVFYVDPARPPRAERALVLDHDTLRSFGSLTIPGNIWRTLQRLGSWVEPVLVGEWTRLVQSYGDRMGRPVPSSEISTALTWLDPARDTLLARNVARRLVDRGHIVRCVWTGTRIGTASTDFDIDHCLPWSAWPCGDLWNLLPASRHVNQRLKRERLPSASALATARTDIISWWDTAWRSDAALCARFDRETAAALPVAASAGLEDIFAALEWRRLRLRQDQQVQEWHGVRARSASVGAVGDDA